MRKPPHKNFTLSILTNVFSADKPNFDTFFKRITPITLFPTNQISLSTFPSELRLKIYTFLKI